MTTRMTLQSVGLFLLVGTICANASYPVAKVTLLTDSANNQIVPGETVALNCTFTFRNGFVPNWENAEWIPTIDFYFDYKHFATAYCKSQMNDLKSLVFNNSNFHR